jgi:23S rRNA pseudouridine2605 synthase
MSTQLIHITQKISQSGLCSRRAAKQLIFSGNIFVNGTLVTNPAIKVNIDDVIEVKGKRLSETPEPRVWLYHKVKAEVTTHSDPQGRATVFDRLPQEMGRVVSVGRLDYNSEGLLVLTNLGKLARYMELPSNEIMRTYSVTVEGKLDSKKLQELEKGCTIEAINYRAVSLRIIRSTPSSAVLEIDLFEGKNREVRKMMAFCELIVIQLIRIQYGPYHLGSLQPGCVMEVKLSKNLLESASKQP